MPVFCHKSSVTSLKFPLRRTVNVSLQRPPKQSTKIIMIKKS